MLRLITIDGKQYAIGLFWQTKPGGDTTVSKKELLALARKNALDLASKDSKYNCVSFKGSQYALGYSFNLPRKVYSLAAALGHKSKASSFVGCFCLADDLWWVYGIANGNIAGDGDTWHTTKEDALNELHSLKQLFTEFEQITCLSPDESFAYFENALTPDAPVIPLVAKEQVNRQNFIKVGYLVTILIVIYAGIELFSYFDTAAEERALYTIQEADSRYKQELQSHPEHFFTQEWRNAPQADRAGAQCIDMMLKQPLFLEGWRLEKMHCAPAQFVTITRQHVRGASFTTLPKSAKLLSASEIYLHTNLSSLQSDKDFLHTQLLLRETMTKKLYQITSNVSCQLEITWEPPEEIVKDDVTLTAPWLTGQFVFSAIPVTFILSQDIFAALTMPGVTISSVTYTDQNWGIQGVVYAKN